MGYIEEIQRQKANEAKAQAFDSMQLQNKIAQIADQAHTTGIDDGLAAAMRKTYASNDGITVDPRDRISSQEIQQAKQLFGNQIDARDIDKMRQLKSLEQINGGSIGAAPDGGLAQQTINGRV